MSPILTDEADCPVAKLTMGAKLNEPTKPVLRNTVTLLPSTLAVTTSGFPSPSISPIPTELGVVPVAKSILVAKEIVPEVEVLRKTDTVLSE